MKNIFAYRFLTLLLIFVLGGGIGYKIKSLSDCFTAPCDKQREFLQSLIRDVHNAEIDDVYYLSSIPGENENTEFVKEIDSVELSIIYNNLSVRSKNEYFHLARGNEISFDEIMKHNLLYMYCESKGMFELIIKVKFPIYTDFKVVNGKSQGIKKMADSVHTGYFYGKRGKFLIEKIEDRAEEFYQEDYEKWKNK